MKIWSQSHDTSAVESENERMLRNKIESLEKQLSNAKKTLTPETITVKTEKEKMLQNQIEILQNQLNELVQELKDTDENNVLKSGQIKDEVTQETVPQDSGVSAPSTIDPEIEKVMKQLKIDNESLRNQLKEARKSVHKTSDVGTEYEKFINELKTENQELRKKIEEIRLKQPRKSLEDPGTTKIINQMTQENELLKKQVEDLKLAQARPPSAGSRRDTALEQLMKDNEALRERLENARKNIPVTSGPQEATESEDIEKLRTDYEILRKQLEDARKMVQSSQEQILADDYTKIIDQLRDENEFLKKRLDSLTDIRSVSAKEVVKIVEKPVEIIKADTDSGKTINELRNLNESLQNELKDAKTARQELEEQIRKLKEGERKETILHTSKPTVANNMVISLERTLDKVTVRDLESPLDEMKKENESLQASGISEVPQVSDQMPTAVTDSERNETESLQKQLADANDMVKSLETTVTELRKQIESLQNKLNDSNAMVQELEDRVKKLTDENNVLKSRQIKDEVTQETVPQDSGVSAPSTIDPEIAKIMKQLKTDNESLRNQREEDRKGVYKTSDVVTEYKKIINELKTENQELKNKIEEIRLKQPIKSLEDPGTKKIINQITQENELLKKQVQDLKMAQARPSSAGPSRDPAFEQLMKENEALRDRLENARKNIPVTSGPQEAIESIDIEKLRRDNEILRKQLEDARKMAQSSQDQILADDYTKIIDQLRDENEFLKKRLDSLTDVRSVSAKEVVKIVEKPVEIIKADTDSEKTINELRNLNESLQNELKDAKTAKQELEVQIRKLKEEKQPEPEKTTTIDEKTVDGDVSQLTEQNELLKTQLTDATKTIEDLTENIAKLKDEIQKLQSTKVPDVLSGAEEHSKELQKLEAELQELRDANNRLRRDYDRLKIELDTVTEDKVPSDSALWKTQEKQLESVVDEKKRRLTTLIAKMSKKEHPGEAGEVSAWKKEREHLLDMIKQLTKELQEGKEALEEKEEMDAEKSSHENLTRSGDNKGKRKLDLAEATCDFMKFCSHASTESSSKDTIDEYDATGISVSEKLWRMDHKQAVYAETLISAILGQGLLNKLQPHTDVCSSRCNNIVPMPMAAVSATPPPPAEYQEVHETGISCSCTQ